MTNYFTRYFLLFALSIPLFSTAQMSDKEKLTEAYYLMDEKRFTEALPLLEEQYKKDKENANINFNIGVAILNSNQSEKKEEALPYLEKAIKNVSPNYKPYNHKEDRAPVDAWYYLGLTQHNQYQFDEAKKSFLEFRTYINDKHYLWEEIDKRIRMAEYAKKAINNPVNIESENLGEKLNSYYPEYSPVVRIDESAIYFTSRRMREDSSNYQDFDPVDGMYYEDIYVSYNDGNEWGEPSLLNINTENHEATLNLSVDGQTLYIYKDENNNGELYFSELLNDSAGIETWSKPQKFGSDINSKAYETHVAVSPDQRTLYFVSEREGGKGGKDIYFCNLLPTGNWALAQNIGSVVNTKEDEDAVFMHPDGKTLYFSSNGHQSMGGYDIMYSTFTDSGWTSPSNMGYPINTVNDDAFFVTTPDGKRAYYSSFKEGGYGEKDIYLLQLLDADEVPLTLYRGEFTFVDRKSPPDGAQVAITNNTNGELVGVYIPRQRDGQFSVILEPNNSYHFSYEADGYDTYEEDIYVPAGASYQEIYKDIMLKPVRVGKGMSGITPAMMQMADIQGVITKNGKVVGNKKVVLLDENENMLQETETDNVGEFNFKQLDPSKTYLIRTYASDSEFLTNYELNVKNDQGEEVVFEELNDSTYIFVPSTYPYEFYGIRAKAISGRIKSGDKAIVGISVRLEDGKRNLIHQEETDAYGEFHFKELNLDNSYRLIFDGELPEDPNILITNDRGEVLTFRKVSEGVYEYVPNEKDRGNQFKGVAKHNGTALSGVSVSLKDSNGKLITQTTTDKNGQFAFNELNLDNSYTIEFDGNFPDDGEIVITNEYDQELYFTKTGPGVYEYLPDGKSKFGTTIQGLVEQNGKAIGGFGVTLQNAQDNTIDQTEVDQYGEFSFSKLNLDQAYQLIFDDNLPDDAEITFTNEFGQKLTFMKVKKGVYRYVPRPAQFAFKSYTIGVAGNPDFQDTYPRPEELTGVISYFQKYFPYNAKDIDEDNKEFKLFINDIADLVKERGYADIIITSSASKVPTKTWKSNTILTKRRADDTKNLLTKMFTEKGLEETQFNFVDLNTLITGPEYNYDHIKNRSTYEKHQYVRIFIK